MNYAALIRKQIPNLLLAGLAGVAGLAGSYAAAGFTPDFIAGPIAGFMARQIPGAVITVAIVVLGDLGHQLNLIGALGLATAGPGGAAYGGLAIENRPNHRFVAPVVAAVGGASLAIIITGALLASLVAGFATGTVTALAELTSVAPLEDLSPDRRRIIGGIGSALVLGIGGFLVGSRGEPHGATMDADIDLEDGGSEMAVDDLLAEAATKSLDVEGLEPLVSDEFYEVDINTTNPTVDSDD